MQVANSTGCLPKMRGREAYYHYSLSYFTPAMLIMLTVLLEYRYEFSSQTLPLMLALAIMEGP